MHPYVAYAIAYKNQRETGLQAKRPTMRTHIACMVLCILIKLPCGTRGVAMHEDGYHNKHKQIATRNRFFATSNLQQTSILESAATDIIRSLFGSRQSRILKAFTSIAMARSSSHLWEEDVPVVDTRAVLGGAPEHLWEVASQSSDASQPGISSIWVC